MNAFLVMAVPSRQGTRPMSRPASPHRLAPGRPGVVLTNTSLRRPPAKMRDTGQQQRTTASSKLVVSIMPKPGLRGQNAWNAKKRLLDRTSYETRVWMVTVGDVHGSADPLGTVAVVIEPGQGATVRCSPHWPRPPSA